MIKKVLPSMTSIWLNYINSFWLLRNYTKACFCMRKHTDISRTIINFLILQKQKVVKLEGIVISWIRVKFSFKFLTWKSRKSFAKKNLFKSFKMFCKVSVKVVSVTIRLYIISERVKLCTIFLHLVSIFANIFRGFASKVTMGEPIVHPHAP